jgi:hypothetical protein
MRSGPPIEERGWFEFRRAREEREARNLENCRLYERWKSRLIYKHWVFLCVCLTTLLAVFVLTKNLVNMLICIFLFVFAYIIFRLCNLQPPMVSRSGVQNQNLYANRIGAGGVFAGIVGGAIFGAGIGIVGGPFGAIAGTIPGAIIGGTIGLFGGRKIGAHVGGIGQEITHESHLGTRQTKPARVGRWTGLLAGAGSGAWIGASLGLAFGPPGAIAGTFPGIIIGSIVGYLGGETIGANVAISARDKKPRFELP